MNNLKLGSKEIKLLLYLGGFVIALLVYQFYFNGALDKNAAMKAENQQLQSDVQDMQTLADNQKDYEKQTEDMQNEMKETLAKFPADIKEEDAILYAKSLQDNMQMQVSSVALSDELLVYTFGQGAENVAEDGTTMAEESNAETAQAASEADAATGDTTNETTTTEPVATDRTAAVESAQLYQLPVALSFNASYDNMKRCLRFINGTTNRTVVDSLSMSYDTATGQIAGTMNYNMYLIKGTDRLYTEPQIDGIGIGTTNIFGGQ